MGKRVDPVRIHNYKKARLAGKSIPQSMLAAGASVYTSKTKCTSQNPRSGLAYHGEKELVAELKLSDITVEKVVGNLLEDRGLAKVKEDYATMVRADELLGKWLSMFTERTVSRLEIVAPDVRIEYEKIVNEIKNTLYCEENLQIETVSRV